MTDMEGKVEYVLSMINEEGDSFVMKADMFFRRRPELVNIIEDCLHGYRALARRYDKLSMVMQNANRTIASAFPEKMELTMDDDFDDFQQVTTSSHEPERPPKSVPPPPAISPKRSRNFSRNRSLKGPTKMMPKKGMLKLGSMNDAAAEAATKASCLSKSEAVVEIDRLQKKILALQTEKEFLKSSYENGLKKWSDIENEVTSMQAKVNSLQDEFSIEKVIEDDEARMLMAATALNSCQEKITTLQEEHEKSTQEAKGELKELDRVRDKFETMIEQLSTQDSEDNSVRENNKSEDSDQNRSIEEEANNLEIVNVSLKEQLQVDGDSSLTVTVLAEKIDELVDTVLNLESVVSSQGALVKRLRSESDKLQEKVQSLEVNKENSTDCSDYKTRIRDLENELKILQSFKESINNADKNFQNKPEQGNEKNRDYHNVPNDGSSGIHNSVESHEPQREVTGVVGMPSPHKNHVDPRAEEKVHEDGDSKVLEIEPNLQSKQGSIHLDDHDELKTKHNENKHDERSTMVDDSDAPEYGIVEGHQPNWRRILLNDLEDREKLLLEEYTSLLRNFKQVKQKLNDSEKKHRANLFKSTLQMKVLKSANASKDAEIQSLQKKLNLLESEHDVSNTDKSTDGDSHPASDTSSLKQREACDLGQVESSESTRPSTVAAETDDSRKYDNGELELESAISSIEEKIRMDLDELLEENIEFWIKYSTSFHQVQKFQTTFVDLRAELSELKESKMKEGSSLQHSDVRPIYMHLREIQTELTLWLEQNVVLEDDLQNRRSSIISIQEEISRSSNADSEDADETELTGHQAAKFTGEVMNMKQQNNKVADELLDGIESVKRLKGEIEKAVAKLDQEFRFSAAKNQQTNQSRSRVPLRSFLFGAKARKQKGSLLARIAPKQQAQQSDACEVQPTKPTNS